MAETLTENLRLSKRDTGDLNWGAGANANLELLDKHNQLKLLRPPRTLMSTLGSGSVGANLTGSTTYFYKVTAINAAGETTENLIPIVVEAQVTQPVTPVPVILQWETVKGATGYRIYKSTSTGTEKFLAEVTGESAAIYTDDGNTAVNSGISVPATNTARMSVAKIIAGSGITVSPPDGTGDVTIQAAGSGVASLKKTGDPGAALTGNVTLEQGAGLQLTQDNPNNKIIFANAGVTGVRKLGEASPLTGDVKLEQGTGITLTQDGPNNKITIAAAAGGGGSGYATVVVAAPSGNATTDTGNISTAMTTAVTNGGTVQLREGTYQINANLSIPAKVTLRGMGRGATILKGQTALDSANAPIITMAGANCALKDLTVDMSLLTGNPSRADISIATSDFEIADCFFDAFKSEGLVFGVVSRGFIHGCGFRNWTDATMRADSSVTDIRIDNCGFFTTTFGDAFLLGNTCERWVFTNCTGDGVRIVFNSAMPPKSSMTNCVWNLGGFQSGLTMGPDCVLSGCVIVNPSNNANVAVVVFNPGNDNGVIAGCRLISGSLGRGIWAFGGNHVFSGNRITATTGITLEGSNNAVSGNRIETGAIVLQPGVSGNVVVGNKATISDNSGQANTIASNG